MLGKDVGRYTATEYTSLMDGHAEIRTDGLGSSVERRKRRSKVPSNVEVNCVFIQFLLSWN